MNPRSLFSQFHNQEKLAKEHREDILYALRILKEATSGEIKKFIDKKVKLELDKKYSSTKYLSNNKKQTAKDRLIELRQKQMSLKTVQKWLKQLTNDYFVTKNKYNVYKLTTEGLSERIFGESYGKMLFDGISKMPLKGTHDERVSEFIRRIGIYIFFIFADNMWNTSLNRNKSEWLNDAVNPNLMFEWFTNEFNSFRMFNFDSQSAQHAATLKEAMNNYYNKVYLDLHEKHNEALRRKIEELEKKLGLNVSA